VSPSLAGFVSARLDEREALALAARDRWDDEDARYEWEDLPDEVFAHARSNDPSWVLRDVAAKRAILARHHDDGHGYCAAGPWGEISGDPQYEISDCPELRDLAAIDSAHPGYDPGWAVP